MDSPTFPIISEKKAWRIAQDFAAEAQSILGESFLAAVAVGSLPAGGYVPGRSDIDLIIVARDECPDTSLAEIKEKALEYWETYKFRKGFGGYGVKESDLYSHKGKLYDVAFEILQMKRQGKVIAGELSLEGIPEPSSEYMKRSLVSLVGNIYGGWKRAYPPPIVAEDARVNQILYWVRIYLWNQTEIYYLGKREAIRALGEIPEATQIFEELDSVRAYVNLESDSPGDVDKLCRKMENFVWQHVSWVRQAANQKDGD